MLTPPPPYHLRPMQLADLDAVLTIDRLSFPTPIKASIYQYEIKHNALAHYQVLCVDDIIIGYAGFWMMADECHVSTIATHPDWRGCGLGELLLLNILFLAQDHAAQMATLEVRQSNQVAQALYRQYRFVVVGQRRGYYKDTGEDALIMTVEPLDGRYHQFLRRQQAALFARLQDEDFGGVGCIKHREP